MRWSNSQLNKLKSGIKYGTEVILNLSSNAIGNFDDENNFLHKLLIIMHKFQSFVNILQMVNQVT